MRMRRMARCTVFFLIISQTARFSVGRWGTLLNIQNMCVDFFYNFLSETFLILRRIKLDIIKVPSLHVKYPSFLSDTKETRIFYTDFRKILKTSNFKDICPVTAELFHADGRTDRQTWRSWQSLSAILRTRLKTHLTSSWTNRFTTYNGQANEDSRQGVILHFWCPLQPTCIASCWASDISLWGMLVEDRLTKLSVGLYLQTLQLSDSLLATPVVPVVKVGHAWTYAQPTVPYSLHFFVLSRSFSKVTPPAPLSSCEICNRHLVVNAFLPALGPSCARALACQFHCKISNWRTKSFRLTSV